MEQEKRKKEFDFAVVTPQPENIRYEKDISVETPMKWEQEKEEMYKEVKENIDEVRRENI